MNLPLSIFEIAVLVLLVTAIIIILILLALQRRNNAANIAESLRNYEKELKDEFARNRSENASLSRASREESSRTLLGFQSAVNAKLDTLTKNTNESMTNSLSKFMETISTRLEMLTRTTQETLHNQQQAVQSTLQNIQKSNEQKLEQMRQTVDEKLQSTLETRLNNSFKLVGERLEAVQKGLGEMQNLANDVGGLKRALSNVKVTGTMGEYQLEALLSQFLSPSQYEKNAHPNPENPGNVVEFAVKIPAKETEKGFIYLPIDSKFPTVNYEKLLVDYDAADKDAMESDRRALVADIKKFAKDIKTKYIEVPYTTDFALLFLPFEGLYSEVVRIPNLLQHIQNEFHVTIVGPTTLDAFLSSLYMGFRTLAIQAETNHVWELLGAVRTEFGKFGNVLEATKKKLESASKEIDSAGVRTRAIERKLRDIESMPEDKAQKLLDY
ncbi:MAG: DNA recombination protein RmuC [Treponema sp.]|nr:DNA recombination protein RmuC [Treponema sp.]